jgi:hypothetical protein
MTTRSVILIGGPDSGKTNYVGRLWPALNSGGGVLVAAAQPSDIGFVLDTAEHIFQGNFAPRSEHTDARRDFEITVKAADGGNETKIVIPDIYGELWKNAVEESEIDSDWMDELNNANGALLFVRVNSSANIHPFDWVTCRQYFSRANRPPPSGIPTQVMLCELIRFLEITLAKQSDGQPPKLSVIVSAWDLVDHEVFERGPDEYIAQEYPLLAGRLKDTFLNVKIFGLSIVGGDLEADPNYREQFLEKGLDGHGWVAVRDSASDQWKREGDLTLPVAWVVGA